MNIRRGIAEALEVGAALLVRQLAWGTSLTGRAVLASLDDDSPVRLTALATANGVSQPAMTQLVSRLEREGLATRLIDPDDGRATLVAISEAGSALRTQLHQSLDGRLVELLSTLSPEEEAALGLAMRVALPLLRQLTGYAAQQHNPPVAS
ncbi:MAG: transcriptional regulator [Mycobacterium sp.]|nr:transcriptional regulator [Mycobacterium sp.]